MTTDTSTLDRRVRDLVMLLTDLTELHEGLFTIIESKTGAMRAADLNGMRAAAVQERALAKRIQDREGLRRQLMDRIGDVLAMAPGQARTMTTTQLLSRVPTAQRQALSDAVAALREAVVNVARVNRVAAGIARGVLGHFRSVFASVTAGEERPTGYSQSGGVVATPDRQIFNAVG
ncbi:MAG: flagellar export chaperone FlgN [Phycisphaerae bacterium]